MPPSREPRAEGPVRVLVVDDSGAVRGLLVRALQLHGFGTEEAERAEDALRMVVKDPPDVIIVDQFMPGMSGAELLRALRISPSPRLREVPVIGLSGRMGSEQALLEAGASCFLAKPFNEQALIKAVRWALSVYGGDGNGARP